MRSTVILFAVLVLAGACSFSPSIPGARVLCTRSGDCPGGQTCEKVEDPVAGGAMVCCRQKGCATALDQEEASRIGRVWAMDLGNSDAGPQGGAGGSGSGGAGTGGSSGNGGSGGSGSGGSGSGGSVGSGGSGGDGSGGTAGTGGTGGSGGSGTPDAAPPADGPRPADAAPDRTPDKPPVDLGVPADTGPAPRPNGASCSTGGQCQSGRCVDGVCCDAACAGRCQACDVAGKLGTCSPVSGAPHGGRSACAGSGTCEGKCDGTDVNNCAYPGMTSECAPPRCQGDAQVARSVCSGSGSCVAPAPVSCGGMGCTNGGCVGGTALGSVQGQFGAGQFTTSAQAPTSVVFSYGFECPGMPIYVFDGLNVPQAGLTANLAPGDDPDFAQVSTALKSGPPNGCGMFRVGGGFRPSPPFNLRGSFYAGARVVVPPSATITFLRLEIPAFTISSSPSGGGETLWETPSVPFTITVYGR
jgi:hypothetical protein